MLPQIFKVDQIVDYETYVADTFNQIFSAYGYLRHRESPIISTCDDTVYFIGSTISVFKQYIERNSIPYPGYHLVQDCLRTQNALRLCDDNSVSRWGSCFKALGTLSPPQLSLADILQHLLSFLHEGLQIARERMLFRVHSQDTDLLSVCQTNKNCPHLEIDAMPPAYYHHKYGAETMQGRNVNIALLDSQTGLYTDIGNMIVIHDHGRALGAELAFGINTILAAIYSPHHSLQTSRIAMFIPIQDHISAKLADAIDTSLKLLKYDIKPNASNHKGRIARKYIQSLCYLKNRLGYSLSEIQEIMTELETCQYGYKSGIGNWVFEYLSTFEELKETSLKVNKQLGKIFPATRSSITNNHANKRE